jgi:hypothetical protein
MCASSRCSYLLGKSQGNWKEREKSNIILYDEGDALLEEKHSSESDELYKAMTASRSHFKKSICNNLTSFLH